MNGPQHYEAAENLLQDAANLYETDASKARFKQAAAHTHAILAQAAATALATDELRTDEAIRQTWWAVAS